MHLPVSVLSEFGGGVTGGGSDIENVINMKSGFEFKPQPRLPIPALHVLSKLEVSGPLLHESSWKFFIQLLFF